MKKPDQFRLFRLSVSERLSRSIDTACHSDRIRISDKWGLTELTPFIPNLQHLAVEKQQRRLCLILG
jgi:hypothetical protein